MSWGARYLWGNDFLLATWSFAGSMLPILASGIILVIAYPTDAYGYALIFGTALFFALLFLEFKSSYCLFHFRIRVPKHSVQKMLVPRTFRMINTPFWTRCWMNKCRTSMCRDFRLAPNRTARLFPEELSVATRTLSFLTKLLSNKRLRIANPSEHPVPIA